MPRAVLLFLLLLLLAPTACADAAITRKKAMWGPIEVDGKSQFPVYADLGVGLYQMSFRWSDVAPRKPKQPRDPKDPAYRWPASVQRAIDLARPHGIQVVLLVQGAPRWANGGKDWRHAPRRPSDFADFVEAAARKYGGVRHWMIWGEPTKATNFQPLAADRGRPLRGSRLRGPRAYARILDASYARLKRLSPRNFVIGGNTFTVGTVAPLRWASALKLPNGKPPRMDAWGHNPFSTREPRLSQRPLGDGFADFGDLDTLVRHLDRVRRRAGSARQRKLPLFLSEYSLPTDHANYVFNFFVSREIQAKWIKMALGVARRWNRIYSLGYFRLYDEPKRPGDDQPEWGLIDRNGRHKPSYEAFRNG